MFDITGLVLFNFKSYIGKHEIHFPTEPGLYFIAGISDLEGNGAGKSSILDAIVWCLFGITPKGLKGTDLTSWGKKGMYVELTLNVRNAIHTIKRQQNPNKLELDGRLVLTDQVVALLGLTKEMFLSTVIAPQGGQSFFELKPAEKLSIFSQVMNLDFWTEKSIEASKECAALDKQCYEHSTKAVEKKDRVNAMRDELTKLVHAKGVFAKTQGDIIEHLLTNRALPDLRQLEGLLEELGPAKIAQRKEEHILNSLEVKLAQKRDLVNTLAVDGGVLKNEMKNIRDKMIDSENEYKALLEFKGVCPTCHQDIDSSVLDAQFSKLEDAYTVLESSLKKEDVKLQENLASLQKESSEAMDLRQKVMQARNLSIDAASKVHRLSQAIHGTQGSVRHALNEIESEQARANPYNQIITRIKAELAAAHADYKRLTRTAEELAQKSSHTSYWILGFKQLRLHLIDTALRTFEIEINNSLTSLGLVDWSVEVDVERENKSGGITKGFVVFIRNADHPDPVRFEAWSGGEAQRLQLAGDLGLANLIMTQAGLTNKIEFYDEPSSYLSPGGLRDLAETLQQRAINEGKKIFLIDHHTYEFGEFTGTYTVTKSKGGSKWEEK